MDNYIDINDMMLSQGWLSVLTDARFQEALTNYIHVYMYIHTSTTDSAQGLRGA